MVRTQTLYTKAKHRSKQICAYSALNVLVTHASGNQNSETLKRSLPLPIEMSRSSLRRLTWFDNFTSLIAGSPNTCKIIIAISSDCHVQHSGAWSVHFENAKRIFREILFSVHIEG